MAPEVNQAKELLELVDDLRSRVEEAAASEKWINDEQFLRAYEEYAKETALAFPDDPLIGNLQISVPPEIDAVISQDPSCLTTWVRMQLGRLAIRLSQHAGREAAAPPDLEPLDLDFMNDDGLREVVSRDFEEAQRAYYAQSPKSAAVLCGSVIEGMLLDALHHSDVEDGQRFADFLKERGQSRVRWDKVPMAWLVDLAAVTERIRPSTAALAHSARDFRNTVHPAVEVRSGSRAGEEDANVLMGIVRLLAGDLANV